MKLKFILSLLFAFSCLLLSAQETDKRIEIDLNDGFKEEQIFPIGENGFVMQSISEKTEKGKTELKVDFYSTDLELIKSESFFIKYKSALPQYYSDSIYCYTFFKIGDEFEILTIDAKNKTCHKTEGRFPKTGNYKNMKAYQQKLIFQTKLNNISSIAIISLADGSVKYFEPELGEIRKKSIEINDFQILNYELIVFCNFKTKRHIEELYMIRCNADAVQKDFFKVLSDAKYRITTISGAKKDNDYILTGTYSYNVPDASHGVFIGELNAKEMSYIKFYNFLKLKTFTNTLTDNVREKIQKRQKAVSNPDDYYFRSYGMLLHPVREMNDGYELLCEAYNEPNGTFYSPAYATPVAAAAIPGAPGAAIGLGLVNYNEPKDDVGAIYSHCSIIKFDKEGNLSWDNTFPMTVVNTLAVIPKIVNVDHADNLINISFSNQNNVTIKSLDATGNLIADNTREIFDTYSNEDERTKKTFSNLKSWYGNIFIAYGAQRIVNNETREKRSVFFVNKIILNKKHDNE